MYKLPYHDFTRLQRFRTIADKCEDIRRNLENLKEITNDNWYDIEEFEKAKELLNSIETKALLSLYDYVK